MFHCRCSELKIKYSVSSKGPDILSAFPTGLEDKCTAWIRSQANLQKQHFILQRDQVFQRIQYTVSMLTYHNLMGISKRGTTPSIFNFQLSMDLYHEGLEAHGSCTFIVIWRSRHSTQSLHQIRRPKYTAKTMIRALDLIILSTSQGHLWTRMKPRTYNT